MEEDQYCNVNTEQLGLAHPCDLSLSLVPLTQELQQHRTLPLTGKPSFSVQVRDEGAGRILTEVRLGK